MKLRTQQPVIVVTGRVQQGDALVSRLPLQSVALLDAAQPPAVAGELRAGLRIFEQLHFDYRASRHHDGAAGQCVRADRRHHHDIELRLDDRSATGQRVDGRPGWGRYNNTVAGVRVDISPVDPRLKIEHSTGGQLLHNDVVEGQALSGSAVCL